jgi:4-hydroxy 2-oxovalerate aldolase
MSSPLIFDSTLRDGSHAIAHQLTAKQVGDYCRIIDSAGFYTVIVGHGNGLGASSIQVGLSKTPDAELLTAAKSELKKTKLGAFILPGFGTIKHDLAPALALGVEVVCVGAHCTEADVTKQYIEYVVAEGKEAYGVLMMYHMTTKERLCDEAQKMIGYGARGIILMDSAGSSTPDTVKTTIAYLVENLSVPVGFHAHNNLGMAVGNTVVALDTGASIVDGTIKGFGAGAGNCQLEALIALLKKMNRPVDANLYSALDASDYVAEHIMAKPQDVTAVSVTSGVAGIFSGFALPVKRAAETFGVDARDIFMELGRRRVVGGQEDMVVEVAMELSKHKKV